MNHILWQVSGVIFDVDGVLVDSEPFYVDAVTKMFSENGVVINESDISEFTGTGEERSITGLAKKAGIDLNIKNAVKRTYDIYLEIIPGRIRPIYGAISFINQCKRSGKKVAVASSSELRKVEGNLKAIGLSFDDFDAVVTGDEVEHKKPAPDIFLLAAKRLGIEISRCLVVEDAITGVDAAKSSGAKCLALDTTFPRESLYKADYIASDLDISKDEIDVMLEDTTTGLSMIQFRLRSA
jgi:HAD superfamily hydrolase (TIGR01509 family)